MLDIGYAVNDVRFCLASGSAYASVSNISSVPTTCTCSEVTPCLQLLSRSQHYVHSVLSGTPILEACNPLDHTASHGPNLLCHTACLRASACMRQVVGTPGLVIQCYDLYVSGQNWTLLLSCMRCTWDRSTASASHPQHHYRCNFDMTGS